ncbi:MAG: helix-turn-helix domain-containing protein [Promethearchaeota archaeon]
MSLKNQTKEIYIRYGLTDFEFEVYLVYLSQPQITASEVAGILEKDLQEIKLITDKLCEINFIKKIEGIINRYIPLEPFFELFVSESARFRDEISKIKDNVLSDQSIRFANLDAIEKTSLETISLSVKTAVEDIFKKADQHDVDKKSKI